MQRVNFSTHWGVNSLYSLKANQLPTPNFFHLDFPLCPEDKDLSMMKIINKNLKDRMGSGQVMAIVLPEKAQDGAEVLPSAYVKGVVFGKDILELDSQLKQKCRIVFVDDYTEKGQWVQIRRTRDNKFMFKHSKEPLLPFHSPREYTRVIVDFDKGIVQGEKKKGSNRGLTRDTKIIIEYLLLNASHLLLLEHGYVYNALVNPHYQMNSCASMCQSSNILFYDEIPLEVMKNTFEVPAVKRGERLGNMNPVISELMHNNCMIPQSIGSIGIVAKQTLYMRK